MNEPSMDAARQPPILIVGQGLAGTLLAWELVRRGRKVLVVDRDEPDTSTKVAAGIVTPISGQRLTLGYGMDRFLPVARSCYSAMELEWGGSYFQSTGLVRLWAKEEEEARFKARMTHADFAAHVGAARENDRAMVDGGLFKDVLGGFEMPGGGWLDTRRWLADAAAWLEGLGMLRRMNLDVSSLRPEDGKVRLPDDSWAEAVVFCEGAEARGNPWFPWLEWKCAKGEVLTISAPDLSGEKRIVNRGGWVMPVDGRGTFRAGATYEWGRLDSVPTAEARQVLEGRLNALLKVGWEVIAHVAGVRPIIHQSLARMGRHPVHSGLVFFNGLGSKGVLYGPGYAAMLAEHLVEGKPLPGEVDVARNG
ncbi:MAG: hypothetical protein JWL81_1958 [Verrucomicrobiales bacterium]|nr:hypothetical protein [Verrucomicrobiales bacterium]